MQEEENREKIPIQLTDEEFSKRMLEIEPFLLGISKRLDKDSLFPEDLVQDTFARMWTMRHMYKYEDSFKAWAKVIMKNVFLVQVQKDKRLGFRLENSDEYSIFDYVKSLRSFNSAYDDILVEDIAEAMKACLSEKNIKIVSLFLEGYTQEEIANMKEFNTNRNNIKQIYFQSIKKVRDYLRDTLGINDDEFKQSDSIIKKSSQYRKISGPREYMFKKKFERE